MSIVNDDKSSSRHFVIDDFILNNAGIIFVRNIMIQDSSISQKLEPIVHKFVTNPEHQHEVGRAIKGSAPPAYILILLLKYWITCYHDTTFNAFLNKLRQVDDMQNLVDQLELNRTKIFEACQPPGQHQFHSVHDPKSSSCEKSKLTNQNCINIVISLLGLIMAMAIIVLLF